MYTVTMIVVRVQFLYQGARGYDLLLPVTLERFEPVYRSLYAVSCTPYVIYAVSVHQ